MKAIIIIIVSVVALNGCAVDRHDRKAAVRGALVGAAGGAAISALTGRDVAAGAAIGAAGGAAVGVVTQDGRQRHVHENDRGQRYWNDDLGRGRSFDGYRR